MIKDIAIIGIGCRFPGSSDLQELAENLSLAKNLIGDLPLERVKATGLPENRKFKRAGYLEDIEKFDHKFFNISMNEAQHMDPHQRLLMEVVQETFENAGYSHKSISGTNTSVYVADTFLEYYKLAVEENPTLKTGNGEPFLASRISQHYDLRGNSANIDTSCASSLSAVHFLCNDLLLGESDYGLACGVNIDLFPFQDEGIDLTLDAVDGISKPFSADSKGMSYGEGVACILLKPLDKAIADNDNVHAVIKGWASNNNAGRAASLTAPDSIAQTEVIEKAWKKSKIDPSTVRHIEAHGSGTQLGDSIEIGGINMAFANAGIKEKNCAISTIKSNIGHTRSASGLSGIIKAVISLKTKKIFPIANFSNPNPLIDFKKASYICDQNESWNETQNGLCTAGVTSIGLSGTNCHIVLQESPFTNLNSDVKFAPNIYTLSGKTPTALKANVEALSEFLKASDPHLPDLSYTLGIGRTHHAHRFSTITNNKQELNEKLNLFLNSSAENIPSGNLKSKTIFIFTEIGEVSQNSIEGLSQRYPYWKEKYDEFLSFFEGIPTEILKTMAFQWSWYNTLEHWQVDVSFVVGVGRGKILASLIAGNIEIDDFRNQLEAYSDSINNIQERLSNLINREYQQNDALTIFTMYGDAQWKSLLKGLEDSQRNIGCTGFFQEEIEDNGHVEELLEDLYLKNENIDWERVFEGYFGKKIEIPTYKFDKTVCWIENPQKLDGHNIASPTISKNNGDFLRDSSEVTKVIAKYWDEVLDMNVTKLEDDFFELGGNSLLATKVISKIKKELKISLDFEDIFDFSTLQNLSKYISGRTSSIKKIELLFTKILGCESVTPSDDFFELGGHSLMANQLIGLIRNEFQIDMNFEEIYENPSVTELADLVDQKKLQSTNSTYLTSISKVEEKEYYELSSAQKRLWVVCQEPNVLVSYNQPEVYKMEGDLSIEILQKTFKKLIERHESLRTIFVEVDMEPVQKILPFDGVDFEVDYFDLRNHNNAEQEALNQINQDAINPFKLDKEPLIRVKLFEVEKSVYLLLFNTHHIIADGWSQEVLVNETFALYNALVNNNSNPLPSLPFQYKDYASWSSEILKSERLAKSREYWLELHKEVLPALALPYDYNKSQQNSSLGERCIVMFSKHNYKIINDLATNNSASLFMVLLSLVKILIYRISGNHEIPVTSPVAGRDHSELENQVGFYANLLALRTKLSDDDTPNDVVKKVKSNVISALDNQLYPFDMLMGELSPRYGKGESPLLNVVVVLQNMDIENINENKIDGLNITEYDIGIVNSKTDLRWEFIVKNDELILHLDYNRELFKEATILSIIEISKELIKSMASSHDLSIAAISLDQKVTPIKEEVLDDLFGDEF